MRACAFAVRLSPFLYFLYISFFVLLLLPLSPPPLLLSLSSCCRFPRKPPQLHVAMTSLTRMKPMADDPERAKLWLIVGAYMAGATEKRVARLVGLNRPAVRRIYENYRQTGVPEQPKRIPARGNSYHDKGFFFSFLPSFLVHSHIHANTQYRLISQS